MIQKSNFWLSVTSTEFGQQTHFIFPIVWLPKVLSINLRGPCPNDHPKSYWFSWVMLSMSISKSELPLGQWFSAIDQSSECYLHTQFFWISKCSAADWSVDHSIQYPSSFWSIFYFPFGFPNIFQAHQSCQIFIISCWSPFRIPFESLGSLLSIYDWTLRYAEHFPKTESNHKCVQFSMWLIANHSSKLITKINTNFDETYLLVEDFDLDDCWSIGKLLTHPLHIWKVSWYLFENMFKSWPKHVHSYSMIS